MSKITVDDNVIIKVNDIPVGEQNTINFISGNSVSISGSNDSSNGVVNLTIAGTSQESQNLNTNGSPTFAALNVTGDITTGGKVDGVDVSAHAADSIIHHQHSNKTNLDAIDQGLGSAGSPTFAGLAVNGDISVIGKIDGVDVSNHSNRHLAGGQDALVGNLDANARVKVKTNGSDAGTRRGFNLIGGKNISLTTIDSATDETVNITIATSTSKFSDLTDIPHSYSGQSGKVPKVNATEDGIVFASGNNFFCVTDPEFGAKGDGVTDDTAAIQKAIDASANNNTQGTVFLPAGIYLITKRINLFQHSHLTGVSPFKTKIIINKYLPTTRDIGYGLFGLKSEPDGLFTVQRDLLSNLYIY